MYTYHSNSSSVLNFLLMYVNIIPEMYMYVVAGCGGFVLIVIISTVVIVLKRRGKPEVRLKALVRNCRVYKEVHVCLSTQLTCNYYMDYV